MELTERQRYLLLACIDGELGMEHQCDTQLTAQEESNLPGYSESGEHDESFYEAADTLRASLRSELLHLREMIVSC